MCADNLNRKYFYIFSTGCIRRALDMILLRNYLEINGWIKTSSSKSADLIVVATCGVVGKNEEHSLKAIRKVQVARKPGSQIVISGCLPRIDQKAIEEIGQFDFVTSGELRKFDKLIDAKVPFESVEYPDSAKFGRPITDFLVARSFCRKNSIYKKIFEIFSVNDKFLRLSVEVGRVLGNIFRTSKRSKLTPYFNIKIADGCMSNCSFCATKLAIGTVKSRAPSLILKEFARGVGQGYKYFQLISEDTGCYGVDLGTNLGNLLLELFAVEGEYRLIIIDYNIFWLIQQQNELFPILIEHQNRIKELYITVQSGSNRILKLMNRDYSADDAIKVLKRLVSEAPAIALRTSLIVGFPGETEADFDATKRLVREIGFTEVNINRYEDRPNTPSSKMMDKVDQKTIEARARELVKKYNCRLLS